MNNRRGRHITFKTDHHSMNCWYLLVIVLVAVGCYSNSLHGNFVHDDIPAIVLNKDVLGTSPILKLLTNDFWGQSMAATGSHKSYRPLTTLTFRINKLLFGLKAYWFHLFNIFLHAVASVLFTKICLQIAQFKNKYALFSGLLFAVHPIHTEAVSGIVGRADVLACIFFSISLLVYHGSDKNPCEKAVWITVALGACSTFCKETGVSIFIVNLLFDLYRNWPGLKQTLIDGNWNKTPDTYQFMKRALRVLVSMAVILTTRLALLQGHLPKFSQQDNPPAFHTSFSVRLYTFCYLAAFNFWLLLCPSDLSHDWQLGSIPLVLSLRDSRNLLTIFTLCTIISLFYKMFMDLEMRKHVPIVLGAMLLVFPFLPCTNLLVTVGFVVAERVLYIPSMGCVILMVYGLQYLMKKFSHTKRLLKVSGILLILFFGLKTLNRNKDWESRESLLKSGLKCLPKNAKMHYNYGNYLRDMSKNNQAKYHYMQALNLWPDYSSAYNNLGTLIDEYDISERYFLAAIHFSDFHLNAHYNLGQLYRKTNRTRESIQMFEICIKNDKNFVPAYVGLAKIIWRRGLSAGMMLKKAISLNEANVGVRLEFGDWLLSKNLLIESLKQYLTGFHYTSYEELSLIAGASSALRKMGQTARLHQMIIRFQIMKRFKRQGIFIPTNIYLSDWSMKNEILQRSKKYDVPVGAKDSVIPHQTDFKMIKIPLCNRSLYVSSKGNNCDGQEDSPPSGPLLLKSHLSSTTKMRRNKKSSKTRFKLKEIWNIEETNLEMLALDKI